MFGPQDPLGFLGTRSLWNQQEFLNEWHHRAHKTKQCRIYISMYYIVLELCSIPTMDTKIDWHSQNLARIPDHAICHAFASHTNSEKPVPGEKKENHIQRCGMCTGFAKVLYWMEERWQGLRCLLALGPNFRCFFFVQSKRTWCFFAVFVSKVGGQPSDQEQVETPNLHAWTGVFEPAIVNAQLLL